MDRVRGWLRRLGGRDQDADAQEDTVSRLPFISRQDSAGRRQSGGSNDSEASLGGYDTLTLVADGCTELQ